MDFGDWLKAIRISEKLGLQDLAHKADVSPATISRIENHKSEPVVETAVKLVNAVSTPSQLFNAIGLDLPSYQQRKTLSKRRIRIGELQHWILLVHKDRRRADSFIEKYLYYLDQDFELIKNGFLPPVASILQGMVKEENRMYWPPLLPDNFLHTLYNHDEVITFGDVGYYLRQVRNSRNLSLRDVENMTGIDDSIIQRIEGGSVWTLKVDMLIRINEFITDNGFFMLAYLQATNQHLLTQVKILDLGKKYYKNQDPIRVRISVLMVLYRWYSQSEKHDQFLDAFLDTVSES